MILLRVTGPNAEDQRRKSGLELTSNPSNKSERTILLVDDESLVLELVTEMLAGDAYHVLKASSGAEALPTLARFQGCDTAFLLSDFHMPEMSGIELAAVMTRERPELEVLLMSGYSERALILNEGWHFLPKPFVTSQLRALVT